MEKVLLIDDDEHIRESTKDLLEAVGYEVESAENGAAGIKLAKSFNPGIIICDVSMPVVDGYAVLEHLSANPATSHIPFIFLTAKAEINDIKSGMSSGADDYICKPFTSAELLKSIENRLKKKINIINSLKHNEFKESQEINENRFDFNSHVMIMSGSQVHKVELASIIFIESLEKYSKVMTCGNKKLIVRKLLKDWEENLPDKHFLRIHKSFIINLNYVKKIEKWFNNSFRVFLDTVEEPLIVSRRYSKKIKDELIF